MGFFGGEGGGVFLVVVGSPPPQRLHINRFSFYTLPPQKNPENTSPLFFAATFENSEN